MMFTFLSAGIVLGLSAGFSPGPLMTLVITQTLRHGVREGFKVAAAPLVTDLPIILAATFLLTRLANYRPLLGVISLIGGLFVLMLAWESFRTGSVDTGVGDAAPQSLGKGIMVNLLSPYPYLFWLTVGAPMIVKGWTAGPLRSVAFVAGFMACLVGAKLAIAVAAGRSRKFLGGQAYITIMRLLGLMLIVFAFLLIRDGLNMLGMI
jgi:threonine/homoserine/homoserine lactone efflux protein